jgi:hypothetical protein
VPGDTYKLTDDFKDGMYAPAWEEHQYGIATAEETGGRLHIELPRTGGFDNWADIRAGVANLRGCSILVRAAELPSEDARASLGFNTPGGNGGVAIVANDGGISLA